MQRRKTYCKVMFGVWIAVSSIWLIDFIYGAAMGELDFIPLIVALFGAVICQLYWELWHIETAVVNILLIDEEDSPTENTCSVCGCHINESSSVHVEGICKNCYTYELMSKVFD